MRRFFDHDPATNQTEFFHFAADEKTFTIETVQDVEPIIEANKRMFNEGDGYTPSRDMKRIASIPVSIVERWKSEYGVDVFDKNHAAGVKRLLNSSDWRYLRTAPGCF